ncbi:MAG TPA: VWA domain-containing protein [Candidatus Dormibacteraeota bacterium]|nr:VWA domain-containing protein [Candidatus Dormibacteraeota bacterium]
MSELAQPGGAHENTPFSRRNRYDAWDGSQEPLPVDAEAVMNRISEDVFAGSDFEFAMRRILSSGWRTPGQERLQGIEELVEQVRRRRLEKLNKFNLEGIFDDIQERLNRILSQERGAIRDRLAATEPDSAARRILDKVAQPKLDRLESLTPEPGTALKELQDYEWMDSGAEQQYRELMDELQKKVAETYFQNINEGMRNMTPEGMGAMKDMLHDLNQMMRDREAGREPDFDSFMKKWGGMFEDPKPQNLDELMGQMAQQMERMESMLQSLSPEQRHQLQDMLEAMMGDAALQEELAELSRHLGATMPRRRLGQRYSFFGEESLPFGAAMDVIGDLTHLDGLERALRDTYRGQPLDPDQRGEISEMLGEDAARAVDRLNKLLQELQDHGYVERGEGGLKLTAQGVRRIGQKALRDLFANLKRDRFGGHDLEKLGPGVEPADETKAWEFGEPFRLNVERTVINAIRRSGRLPDIREEGLHPGQRRAPRMQVDDFEVYKVDASTQAATVLMLDMSRSMPLRGNFYAAKKMAMALEQLIHSQYPRDELYIIGFSDRARDIRQEHLPQLSSMECVYGTNMQAGFMRARQLLSKHAGANKQIIMVSDGEPTAHLDDHGGVVFAYPPVEETFSRTLMEVQRCTQQRITINCFMLETNHYLRNFIKRLTRLNRGRAFFVNNQRLGDYVLVDFVNNRRQATGG